MSKTRLFVDDPIRPGTNITLHGDQARYVGRVLRLRPGDVLSLFDGKGGEWHASILGATKDSIDLAVAEKLATTVESPLRITLVQGISRGDRMDFAVQKATELGVVRISPVLTERSVVKLDSGRAGKKQLHWRSIVISACEQCGRNYLPQVDAPTTLPKLLADYQGSVTPRIVMRPGSTAMLKSVDIGDGEVIVLVGPEGGLSDIEYENAEVAGFRPVGFGPRVLRTETAALAVIAALQTLHGDLS